jgi:ArsR family transcriptional regulator
MRSTARMFHLFSDETRLRILMLLSHEELFVCKLMAVLGVSQSLASRNLTMLRDADILHERKEGKLVYYSLNKDMPKPLGRIIKVIREELASDPVHREDLDTLEECHRFQQAEGSCDMKTFTDFMEKKKKQRKGK